MPPTQKMHGALWQEEIRKIGGDQLLAVLVEIRDAQCGMIKRIDNIETGIGDAIKEHVNVAFAGGDAEGHRRAHETMIAMMEEKRRMYANLKDKTLSALLWVCLVWVGYTVLNGIRHALGLPPV